MKSSAALRIAEPSEIAHANDNDEGLRPYNTECTYNPYTWAADAWLALKWSASFILHCLYYRGSVPMTALCGGRTLLLINRDYIIGTYGTAGALKYADDEDVA